MYGDQFSELTLYHHTIYVLMVLSRGIVPDVLLFSPRDAMLARSLRQRRVRPYVRLSDTRRYCA